NNRSREENWPKATASTQCCIGIPGQSISPMEAKPSIPGTTWQRLLRWKNTREVYPRSALRGMLQHPKREDGHVSAVWSRIGHGGQTQPRMCSTAASISSGGCLLHALPYFPRWWRREFLYMVRFIFRQNPPQGQQRPSQEHLSILPSCQTASIV